MWENQSAQKVVMGRDEEASYVPCFTPTQSYLALKWITVQR